MKKYYDALEEDKFLGIKCETCGYVSFPPFPTCNVCGSIDTDWVEIEGTSTKIAYYEDDKCKIKESFTHDVEVIKQCADVTDQYGLRRAAILKFMEEYGIKLSELDSITSRGGQTEPITEHITKRVGFIAPVVIMAGEREMEALAEGTYRALKGEIPTKIFVPKEED